MEPQEYEVLTGIPSKKWPLFWKHHFHVWLFDAAFMMVGAWIFLVIGHVLLRIIVTFLK